MNQLTPGHRADKKPMKQPLFCRKIRMMYMECRLFLGGEVNQSAITQFGISRQSASEDFAEYLAAYKTMRYDASAKKYRLTPRAAPKLVPRSQLADFAFFVERVAGMAG